MNVWHPMFKSEMTMWFGNDFVKYKYSNDKKMNNGYIYLSWEWSYKRPLRFEIKKSLSNGKTRILERKIYKGIKGFHEYDADVYQYWDVYIKFYDPDIDYDTSVKQYSRRDTSIKYNSDNDDDYGFNGLSLNTRGDDNGSTRLSKLFRCNNDDDYDNKDDDEYDDDEDDDNSNNDDDNNDDDSDNGYYGEISNHDDDESQTQTSYSYNDNDTQNQTSYDYSDNNNNQCDYNQDDSTNYATNYDYNDSGNNYDYGNYSGGYDD